ncbi:MAG: hypothetical protein WBW36_01370 [Candidatus Sulfotelmatobacter sp.]
MGGKNSPVDQRVAVWKYVCIGKEAGLLKTCRKKGKIKLDWVIVCSKDEYYLIARTARW